MWHLEWENMDVIAVSVRENVNRNNVMNIEGQQSDTKGPRTNGEHAQPNEHLLKEGLICAAAISAPIG
jgi:hypothetical protein